MNDELSERSLQQQCQRVMTSCVSSNLRKASRAVTQFYAHILNESESKLEPTQFTLLVACVVAGSAPIGALAEALVMDRTTLIRNLRLLEKQGLVSIAEGVDRRTRLVTLSPEGRQALVRTLPFWEKAQAQVVERFGPELLSHLLGELARLVTLTHPV